MGKDKIAVVIDDECFIRDLLDKVFTSLGYETRLYASALEMPCLSQNSPNHCEIDDTLPEILITDVQMPGMSGIELILNLRENGCRIKKVALMSGFCNKKLRNAAESLECKAFPKPFDVNDIKEWAEE